MIELKNKFVVRAIAKTSTRLFKDMKVDDVLEISIAVSYTTGRRGNYASYYDVKNLRANGERNCFSSSELSGMEDKGFVLERIDV